MELSEPQVKKQQLLTAGALLIMVIGVVACVLWASGSKKTSTNESALKPETVRLADAARSIRPEDAWLANAEVSLKQQNEQFKELQTQLEQLKSDQESLRFENENLKAELAANSLPKEAAVLGESEKLAANGSGQIFPRMESQATHSGNIADGSAGVAEPILAKHTVALTPKQELQNKLIEKSLTNYVPIGSYVKAVILSGVSASAAVKSQADPLPILFRITGPAVTANNQEIDLSGCTVTGEAYGDISSERAFVRLHDMTCSKQANKIIETKVEGYAAALGTGIQGKVISREGALIQSSFWSGLFGGIGQATSQASTTISTNPLGSVESVKGEDMLKNAIGKGIASSAERISKYHIERAEQYHPVIEIKASREVELVFIRGAYLDGRPSENISESKAG